MTGEMERLYEGKLDDPLILDAALGIYGPRSPMTSARRSAMESAWFDATFLSRQLDTADHRTLERLVRLLPDHVFAPLAAEIAERWDSWPEELARCSIALLAQFAPETAKERFAAKIDSGSCDPATVREIVEAVPRLPALEARDLLAGIATWALKDDERANRGLLAKLLEVALLLDRVRAREILPACFEHAEEPDDVEQLFTNILRGVFVDLPFGRLAREIRSGMSVQKLATVPLFFKDGAPLAELDCHIRGPADPEELVRLLDAWMPPDDCELIVGAARMAGKPPDPDWRAKVEEFLIDALASVCVAETMSVEDLDLQGCLALLAADLPRVPCRDLLVERLRGFPPERTVDAVAEAFESSPGYASETLATVMGDLGLEGFVVPLTRALAEDCDYFLCELAADSLASLGPRACDHLIGEWERLDQSQRIYGRSVIEAVGGAAVAEFTLHHLEAQLANEMETACWSALAAPDRRMIAILTPHLKRGQEPIDKAFYVLARLYDESHPQLGEITKRLSEARTRMAARLQADGSVLPDGSIDLHLECSACGEVNSYGVKRIVEAGHGEESYLIGEEFPCVSCGEFADFKLTPLAKIGLLATAINRNAGTENGEQAQNSVVEHLSVQNNGQVCTVGEMISDARDALAGNPRQFGAWTMLGASYQVALDRPVYARQFFDRALEIEPRAIDATVWKAIGHEQLGENEEAFRLLDDALSCRAGWVFDESRQNDSAAFGANFARRYNNLLKQTKRTGRQTLQSEFLTAVPKAGRNDPCPCGSGRKYKRCCLLRAGR